MDQSLSRLKLSENFERHWSMRISGETSMEQSLVHIFSWGNSYGPMSQSPTAGHPKAGRSDFRNQRFKPDTGKMRKMRTSLPPQENKGLRRLRRTKARKTRNMRKMRMQKRGKCGKNAEYAENADAKTRKMRKIRMTGLNVIGFR